ncbi:carbohydrate sulfotransferase 1-like [Tachypleus tridentatus]|uniref:carbohydrate sulfotransferase 1-like n=1 Tax=Tachypleus tridentatus TaxID=6853 RepID=UPI003FCF7FAA
MKWKIFSLIPITTVICFCLYQLDWNLSYQKTHFKFVHPFAEKMAKNNSTQKAATRVLLITYLRSGSTFTGEVLQHLSDSTFYDYEPLHHMSLSTRLHGKLASDAIDHLLKLFRCNYVNETYLKYVQKKENLYMLTKNTFMWKRCKTEKNCSKPSVMSSLCNKAKVHVMKVLRLPLSYVQQLLEKATNLDIRVIYLVRDPRGIYGSRKSRSWCRPTNCSDITVLCDEIWDDLVSFYRLQKAFPGKFHFLRFEDIALKPFDETKKLLKSLGFQISKSLKKYLEKHMFAKSRKYQSAFSTFRNSSSIPSKWHSSLTISEKKNIKKKCGRVLKKLGQW